MKKKTSDERVIVSVVKLRTMLAVITFACVLYSCSRQLGMPVSTDAAKQRQLLEGRKLYVDHCSGCHNLHLPGEFDVAGWEKHLDEMQARAKITDAEKQLIFQFIASEP